LTISASFPTAGTRRYAGAGPGVAEAEASGTGPKVGIAKSKSASSMSAQRGAASPAFPAAA
jgi:hypothetical protein